MCLISNRLKEVAVEEADQITSADECCKMFSAAKQLRSKKPAPPIIVQDTATSWERTKAKQERSKTGSSQLDEPLQRFEGTQ